MGRNGFVGAAFLGVVMVSQAHAFERSVALDAVRAKLRDPQSAQFDGVQVSSGGVCGFVNAKNAYGGYVGRMVFSVKQGGDGPDVTLGDDPVFVSVVQARCKTWGIALPPQ